MVENMNEAVLASKAKTRPFSEAEFFDWLGNSNQSCWIGLKRVWFIFHKDIKLHCKVFEDNAKAIEFAFTEDETKSKKSQHQVPSI